MALPTAHPALAPAGPPKYPPNDRADGAEHKLRHQATPGRRQAPAMRIVLEIMKPRLDHAPCIARPMDQAPAAMPVVADDADVLRLTLDDQAEAQRRARGPAAQSWRRRSRQASCRPARGRSRECRSLAPRFRGHAPP